MITELLDSNLSSQAIRARAVSRDQGPSGSNSPAFFSCWDSVRRTVGDIGLTS